MAAWALWALWALTMLGVPVIAWLDQLSRQAGRPELAQLIPSAVVGPVLGMVSATTVGGGAGQPHDAALTIAVFSARLRDELDLDTLSAELLLVVDQAMQPTTASLWLRPPIQPPATL